MSRFWTIFSIFIYLVSFLLFPVQDVEAYTKAPLPETTRVDSTDFPTLYLSTPQLEGDAIWLLQARLRELGYGLEPNGQYDQFTSEIVKLFQVANNLQVDGVVTRLVWEKVMFDQENEPCLADQAVNKKIWIEIDLDKHRLTVFENNQVIRSFPVGIGKSSTHSPLGVWKVVHKAVNWGNGFGTRWMGLNVPWGIYGIHGTNKPYSVGRSESHGCIRMLNKDVEALYPLIPMGTTVRIIENGQTFPKDFIGNKLTKQSSGKNVVYLQNRLKEKGIILAPADGKYGNMTVLAVKYYQVMNGLTPTGEADQETFRALGMIK